jgi:hypothetical protein
METFESIDRRVPATLPRPDGPDGAPRRVGVEIEFGGLSEARAAETARALLGGAVESRTAHDLRLSGSAIGDVKIYLDTAWRDRAGTVMGDLGLDLSRAVVPVEVVTDPILPADLPRLDDLARALHRDGATGSRDGLFLGFGLHLNVAIAGDGVDDILPVVRAYALLEDWLRYADPIDPSRRVLPFADPYPRGFVDRIAAEGPGWSLAEFIDVYLAETPTRDRGLDMLPAFMHLAPDRVAAAIGTGTAVSARPTFHYRLPDSRIDDPAWSITYEWNRWALVERLAAQPDVLDRLARQWADYRGALTTVRPDWLSHLDRYVARHLLTDQA